METPFWVDGAAELMKIGKMAVGSSNRSGRLCKLYETSYNKSGRRCKSSDEITLICLMYLDLSVTSATVLRGRVNPAVVKRKSDICHTVALQTDPPQTVAFGGSRFLNSCWKSHTASRISCAMVSAPAQVFSSSFVCWTCLHRLCLALPTLRKTSNVPGALS